MRRKAFTLVELLVVIAIIGLLSTVAVVALGSSRSKSRNTKRIADIRQIATSFSLALNDSASGAFPVTADWVCLSSSCAGASSSYFHDGTVDDFISSYLPNAPTDPTDPARGRSGYLYDNPYGGPQGSGAYLNYQLEIGGDCSPGTLINTQPNFLGCVLKL